MAMTMTRRTALAGIPAAFGIWGVSRWGRAAVRHAGPIAIGNRLELLVDYELIESLTKCRLVPHHPHDEGVVLKFDRPWEGLFCSYATVIKDECRYRLYYRGRPDGGADGDDGEVTCYAESRDGIDWEKPHLGLFEVHGTRDNNVILAHAAPFTHNLSPFLDRAPDAAPEARFKALGGTMKSGLVAFGSPDGIHWKKLQEEPVIPVSLVPYRYMFDSQNVSFWSEHEQQYLSYFRVFEKGMRSICRSTSSDFLHWTKPEFMEYRYKGEPFPLEHLYTNQTHPYFRAPHLYISIAARFMPGRQVLDAEEAKAIGVHPKYFKDTSDAVLMTSRARPWYDRTFPGSFIRPGIGAHNWVSRTNYPALNVVPTGDTEMSVYVNQDYAQPTAHLRRYSLRLDGFASAQADYFGGELLTKPLVFDGDELMLNFSTSAAGQIQVELQDAASGEALTGFEAASCRPVIGNEIARRVQWKDGPSVREIAGKPVRLRFVMKDADLFAFQFQ